MVWPKRAKATQGWRSQATLIKPKKRIQWEQMCQMQCVAWFKFTYPQHRKPFYHIPNEGLRPVWVGRKLNAMGMKTGMLDIHLDVPSTAKNGKLYYGLRIEMKPAKKDCPSKVTPEQRETIQVMNDNGYFACVCYGYDEFKDVIQWYLP